MCSCRRQQQMNSNISSGSSDWASQVYLASQSWKPRIPNEFIKTNFIFKFSFLVANPLKPKRFPFSSSSRISKSADKNTFTSNIIRSTLAIYGDRVPAAYIPLSCFVCSKMPYTNQQKQQRQKFHSCPKIATPFSRWNPHLQSFAYAIISFVDAFRRKTNLHGKFQSIEPKVHFMHIFCTCDVFERSENV